jgi:hypothetical protein
MSLNDIQNELQSIKSNSTDINETSHNTIEDILKNNVERLEKFMDSKVINIYSRPWNKLEPKLKKKKIEEYLNSLLDTKTITLNTFNILFNKLSRDIILNEKIKLEYDTDKCSIISFDYESYL